MDRVREAEVGLLDIFKTSATKHEANARARPLMEQLSRDPSFLSTVLAKYLATPGSLDKQHYPVVGVPILQNPWFGLVANCWIPLPGGETNITTKAIHNHGPMLLTTATLFGPGYEHWMFTLPKPISEGSHVYRMDLLEAAPHPQHHVSFVDAYTGHVPVYPSSLSITLALWSNSAPTTVLDRIKRMPPFRGREEQIRPYLVKLGLKKKLALKTADNLDYYPEGDGFRLTSVRTEFPLGPNEDHVHSVFHILQKTGNEALARTVRDAIAARKVTRGRSVVERLVGDLERGTPIEGRLSAGHHGVPRMNFTTAEIERALAATAADRVAQGASAGVDAKQGEANGRKFTAEARSEASAGARPR